MHKATGVAIWRCFTIVLHTFGEHCRRVTHWVTASTIQDTDLGYPNYLGVILQAHTLNMAWVTHTLGGQVYLLGFPCPSKNFYYYPYNSFMYL
jgi:hypothetical protein